MVLTAEQVDTADSDFEKNAKKKQVSSLAKSGEQWTLFFLAFLPQFVNRNANVAPQIIFLGVLFNTSGTVVNVIVALIASYAGFQFRTRMGNSTIFRWLTGGIFIGLGLRLGLLERK